MEPVLRPRPRAAGLGPSTRRYATAPGKFHRRQRPSGARPCRPADGRAGKAAASMILRRCPARDLVRVAGRGGPPCRPWSAWGVSGKPGLTLDAARQDARGSNHPYSHQPEGGTMAVIQEAAVAFNAGAIDRLSPIQRGIGYTTWRTRGAVAPGPGAAAGGCSTLG